MAKGSIVIISGPIGAGKTTLARALVEISPAPVACIEGDEFWKFIAKADSSVKEGFQTIMSSMTAAAVPFALRGYEVILDFSVPPWYLERCQKIVSRREIPLHYVVFMPSQGECARRAAERVAGKIEDYEPYAELYRDFLAAERYMVGDDGSDPTSLAREVREGIDSGKFLVA